MEDDKIDNNNKIILLLAKQLPSYHGYNLLSLLWLIINALLFFYIELQN